MASRRLPRVDELPAAATTLGSRRQRRTSWSRLWSGGGLVEGCGDLLAGDRRSLLDRELPAQDRAEHGRENVRVLDVNPVHCLGHEPAARGSLVVDAVGEQVGGV